MVGGAAGVFIDDGDELGDRMFAIADNMCWFAAASGDELFTDDQEPVVIPFGELLNDHRIPLGLSGFEGGIDLLTGEEIQ